MYRSYHLSYFQLRIGIVRLNNVRHTIPQNVVAPLSIKTFLKYCHIDSNIVVNIFSDPKKKKKKYDTVSLIFSNSKSSLVFTRVSW